MLTLIKALKNEFDFIKSDIKEVRLNMIKEADFEINNYRFIHSDRIDDILEDELLWDEYVLGCFNAWFISDIIDMDIEAVEALQKADKYEVLGKMMIPHIEKVAEEYVRHDGYGHHFAHYDGYEHEFDNWYIFRVN